jgi:RimJ/RimL family protein N-acetyltransferase
MPLRPAEAGDADIFMRLCASDRIEDMTCRPIGNGRRVADDGRRESWTFIAPGDGAPAGWVTLFNLNPRNRSAEFGYGIVPPLRRQRLATTILAEAFDLFFPMLDLNKLYCQTASFNTASVRLLKRLGMTRDAILRAHHEKDGRLLDDYIYSLLRQEWRQPAA